MSYILWEGPSELNGSPIVVIATGIDRPSVNRKTGPLATIWYLHADVHPSDATAIGEDAAICGACPLRKSACYVDLRVVITIWRSYKSGAYQRASSPADLWQFVRPGLRWGGYGDPASVPYHVTRRHILGYGWLGRRGGARFVRPGYTHQWRTCDQRYRALLMASVETTEQAREAQNRGWRTYRIARPGEPPADGEIWCPHRRDDPLSPQCADCGLCDGTIDGHDARPSIVVPVHGAAPRVQAFVRHRLNIL